MVYANKKRNNQNRYPFGFDFGYSWWTIKDSNLGPTGYTPCELQEIILLWRFAPMQIKDLRSRSNLRSLACE